jgi:hypothetical protein
VQLDGSVRQQNAVARLQVANKILVGGGCAFGCAFHRLNSQRKAPARLQPASAFPECAEPDLRSLEVQQNAAMNTQVLSHLADPPDPFRVLVLRPMGGIQAKDIHACLDQSADLLRAIGRRAQRGYDFRQHAPY